MAINIQKSKRLKWAIVVDETELVRLDDVIRESLSSEDDDTELEYSVKCSDGALITVNEIDDVIQENNSKESRIDSIKIYASTHDKSKRISLTLGGRRGAESIDYSVTGNSRDWVYLTTSKLCDRFKNLKQWYTPISRIDWWLLAIIGFFIFVTYVNLQPTTESTTSTSFVDIIVTLIILFGSIALVPTILNKITRHLFPSYVFCIGDGIKEHDKLQRLRLNLFWTVMVGLMVSIFGGYVLMYSPIN